MSDFRSLMWFFRHLMSDVVYQMSQMSDVVYQTSDVRCLILDV